MCVKCLQKWSMFARTALCIAVTLEVRPMLAFSAEFVEIDFAKINITPGVPDLRAIVGTAVMYLVVTKAALLSMDLTLDIVSFKAVSKRSVLADVNSALIMYLPKC